MAAAGGADLLVDTPEIAAWLKVAVAEAAGKTTTIGVYTSERGGSRTEYEIPAHGGWGWAWANGFFFSFFLFSREMSNGAGAATATYDATADRLILAGTGTSDTITVRVRTTIHFSRSSIIRTSIFTIWNSISIIIRATF